MTPRVIPQVSPLPGPASSPVIPLSNTVHPGSLLPTRLSYTALGVSPACLPSSHLTTFKRFPRGPALPWAVSQTPAPCLEKVSSSMNIINTITIELVGSYIACHVESGITVDLTKERKKGTTKSAIPDLCRKLIAEGFSPDTRVHVIRKALDRDDFIPVFVRDRPLSKWAAIDCIENARHGPRFIKYRPFPDAVAAKSRRSAARSTKSASESPREKNPPTASERRRVAA